MVVGYFDVDVGILSERIIFQAVSTFSVVCLIQAILSALSMISK